MGSCMKAVSMSRHVVQLVFEELPSMTGLGERERLSRYSHFGTWRACKRESRIGPLHGTSTRTKILHHLTPRGKGVDVLNVPLPRPPQPP
jgi:hypothetical protein